MSLEKGLDASQLARSSNEQQKWCNWMLWGMLSTSPAWRCSLFSQTAAEWVKVYTSGRMNSVTIGLTFLQVKSSVDSHFKVMHYFRSLSFCLSQPFWISLTLPVFRWSWLYLWELDFWLCPWRLLIHSVGGFHNLRSYRNVSSSTSTSYIYRHLGHKVGPFDGYGLGAMNGDSTEIIVQIIYTHF